ncbi:hypothetical protein [Burkholderia sp. SCN-KJ]|uniref:hypothetical protein n=1 Tax=Burkholderia sp. SCN-KJ TaxID=2969248 RepID=UPI00214FD118|nr:hypothetical protein [Burkholderia sp. SCN-KJ]MCR4470395.1 hypothetical protein [Burkholderia sp. SCN-KJ]
MYQTNLEDSIELVQHRRNAQDYPYESASQLTAMKSTILNAAESLRNPENTADPDPRTTTFPGQALPSLVAHHHDIEAIQLIVDVPEAVAIQFETARNLYLYAWHVYRFFPVAQSQVLFTLELGLRLRFPARLPPPYQRPRQPHAMLSGLLDYAIDQGLIRNEGFRRWHRVAEDRARERRSMEIFQTMIDQQLDAIEVDDDESLNATPEDQGWDLVRILRRSLPSLRNELAHGSSMLTNQVLGTIELVAEILSQIYAPDSGATVSGTSQR